MTTWSIAEVARMAGISSRTLRHYDRVGLLAPSHVGANGYRYYGRDELRRLQEVLVLRELGLGLPAIARVVDGTSDRAAVLREHQGALLRESERLARLAASVGRTVTELAGGERMAIEEMFDGFDGADYADEVVQQWGQQAYGDGQAVWARLGPEGRRRHVAEHEQLAAAFAVAMSRGADPGDDDVQELVGRHHAWVSVFWTPGREAYTGLGRTYADDRRFARNYDKHAEGAAVFVRDAISVYAERRLT